MRWWHDKRTWDGDGCACLFSDEARHSLWDATGRCPRTGSVIRPLPSVHFHPSTSLTSAHSVLGRGRPHRSGTGFSLPRLQGLPPAEVPQVLLVGSKLGGFLLLSVAFYCFLLLSVAFCWLSIAFYCFLLAFCWLSVGFLLAFC